MHLFEDTRVSLLTGDLRFEYGGSFIALEEEIRRSPLQPRQVHLWEFEIPGDLQGMGKHEEEPDKEWKRAPRRDPVGISRKVLLHQIRQHILGSYLTCNPADIRLSYGPFGQPVIDRESCPFSFSTSYADQTWLLAIGYGHQVGTDIENITNKPGLLDIAQRFFYPREWNYVRSLLPAEQVRSFFQLWTLKEAYLKATGTGWSGWEDLPDMTHCISTNSSRSEWTCNIAGGYQAFLMTTASLCKALVYSRFG